MPLILFWLGLVGGMFVYWMSLWHSGEDKRGVVITPLLLIIAAAVAKYLGL